MNAFGRTALTLAIAASLGGYLYFVESKKEPKTDAADGTTAKKEKVFTGFDKLKVKSITLKKRNGEVIEAEKNGETWELVSPRAVPADASSMGVLLDALQDLQTEDVVSESATDLAPFGLAEPKVAVSAVVEGATKPFEFELGDSVPAGSGLFARVPGKPRLFTVSSTLENSLDKSAFDLRDRSLIKMKKDDLKWFEALEKGKSVFRLARGEKGEDEWKVEKPLLTRAARWTVEGFLSSLENLRMESIPTEQATAKDLAGYGLGGAARRVVLGFDGGKSLALEIGKKAAEGTYYAREASSPVVATINASVVSDLDKGLKNFRAGRLMEIASYEVTGFDATAGAVSRTFTKSTTKGKDGIDNIVWKSTAPVKDATQDDASAAFFAAGGLEVADFIDAPKPPAAYGLDAPALKVVLRFDGDKKEDWFEVSVKGEEAYGRRRGDNAVLKLDKAKTEELIKSFTKLGA